ncbi:membrane glycoprotein US3 [Cercopithecine betaherpesvirus 5]|uniref:Membrane glycoprotein US3 n=1 Tax=Simian cytomegalovirus (strain Colburn) TaxID=50292 RepID=G8XTL1_SCMVC|nr:membrane glycoprotein US3 [Cercopithecine betaherpesvirus 5]AEV80503.1 membrane glycoprotein US3 [Cercopithecine betaherpesvirus 5]
MKPAYVVCGLLSIILMGMMERTESAPYQRMFSSYKMLHSKCYVRAGKVYGTFTVESDFLDMKHIFVTIHRKGLYGTAGVTLTRSTDTTRTYTLEDSAHSTTRGVDLVIVGLYDVHHTFQCHLDFQIDLSPESAVWYAEKIQLENNWWLFAKILFYLVVTTGFVTYLTMVVNIRLRLMGEVSVSTQQEKV